MASSAVLGKALAHGELYLEDDKEQIYKDINIIDLSRCATVALQGMREGESFEKSSCAAAKQQQRQKFRVSWQLGP